MLSIVLFLAFAQSAKLSDWLVYKSATMGFEIKYPSMWKISVFDNNVKLSTYHGRWLHSIGLPARPNPWIDISRVNNCKGIPESMDFRTGNIGLRTRYHGKTICRNNIVLDAGYWDSDKNQKANKQILNKVIESFKILQ